MGQGAGRLIGYAGGMKLVVFGSGAFGVPTFAALARGHDVAMVVTQPDKPAGRGAMVTPTAVAAWAAAAVPETPVLKPERVNAPEIVDRIRAVGADAWVVIAFGQKLGRALLDGVFAINLHASRLPRWRGAAPINAAILAGDAVTGNSVITLADRMDAGLVLGMSERAIPASISAGELHDQLSADGPELVGRVLAEHRAGTLRGAAQDDSLVTIAPKMSKADAWIDLSRPADEARRRIHAFNPWPGVAGTIDGVAVKLHRAAADIAPTGPREPGRLLDAGSGLFRCGDDAGGRPTALRIIEIQPVGKRVMAWGDFARGRTLPPTATLCSGPGERS